MTELTIRRHYMDGPPRTGRPKYANARVKTEFGNFDSQGEFKRWQQLRLLEQAGKISDLQRQVKFELAPSCHLLGRKRPPIRYFADFVYFEKGQKVVEDYKGYETPEYKLKRHLMMTVHGIEIKQTV